MQQDILLEMIEQSRLNCSYTFKDINTENLYFRLNEKTASVGFIYRHIGETTHTLGRFLGFETDVQASTIGQTDTGKKYDMETSCMLFEQGYTKLQNLIKNTPDNNWLEEIETPFLGKISKTRLLSFILFHNSHHCGQIASAITKGSKTE